nr:putative capsid [Marmot picobirnavirus]
MVRTTTNNAGKLTAVAMKGVINTMANEMLNYTNYVTNEQLAKDKASFAFGTPMGEKFELGYTDTTYASRALGVLAFESSLTIGNTNNGFEAPINKAGRGLYSRYWEKNSSISAFQPQDIVVYTYGSAQCVALLGWMCNIYGVRKYSNANSRYTQSALYSALGVDPKDIILHLTDLRGFINSKIVDLMNVRLDANVPLYKYAFEMYRHVYLDSPNTTKTQLYTVKPKKVLKYQISGQNIGGLQYVDTPDDLNGGHLMTYKELTDFVDDIWSAFFGSSVVGSISAAIGKATDKFYSADFISEEYATTPVFDARALMRYKNASVRPGTTFDDITQDVVNKALVSKAYAHNIDMSTWNAAASNVASSVIRSSQFLHSWSAQTQTPQESVVTGSLLTAGDELSTIPGGQRVRLELTAFGFEVLTGAYVCSITNNGQIGYASTNFWRIRDVSGSTMVDIMNELGRAASLVKEFEFAPTAKFALFTSPTTNGSGLVATYVDTDDYVIVGTPAIAKLHDIDIFSILGVPAT